MSGMKLQYRFRNLALIAALCAIIAGRAGFAQDSPEYIQFLEQRSMLYQSDIQALQISGEGIQWRNTYGLPEPSEVVKEAPVWLLDYPYSVITKPNQSVIASWGDPQFWENLKSVGIKLLHTNPVKRAGGITGTEYTPTIDGGFDRISLEIEPQIGTADEYRKMTSVAGQNGAIIAGDLVPLHTGLGPDFRLAERAYKEYPGMYTMVEIAQKDWGLLPTVSDTWGHELVPKDAAVKLKELGYIPGLVSSSDADPDAKNWSSWSATPEIVGVDKKTRRWVYLHVFKPAQPTLNWLDPSYAARRVQFGDAAWTITNLGGRVLRLDATPFLGLEPDANDNLTWNYEHPLSIIGANDLASMIRKLGGWSFQELNVPSEQLKQYTQFGPDLSYDFFTRAQVLHPLITGDVLPLRLAHSVLLQQSIQTGTLIHDMQNHDEITYQLIDLGSRPSIDLDGQKINGPQLADQMQKEMRAAVGDQAAPYNKLYRPAQDGIATTFAGFIAPALGVKDPYHASPDEVALIRRGHLLVAHANAMQPGVFAISAWDLVGALPVAAESVADRTQGGDWRWINRGSVDLLGVNTSATKSAFNLPKAQSLYGSVPDQLASPDSFVSQLKKMLAGRNKYRIAEGQMLAVPPTGNKSVCVLAMRLPDSQNFALTALNYGRDAATVDIDLTMIPPGIPAESIAGKTTTDIVSGQSSGDVSSTGHLTIQLDGLSGRTILVPRQ